MNDLSCAEQIICNAGVASPYYLINYDSEVGFTGLSIEGVNIKTYSVEYFSRIIGALDYKIGKFSVLLASPLSFIFPVSSDKDSNTLLVELSNKILFDMFLGGIKTYAIIHSDIGLIEVNKHGFYMLIDAAKSETYNYNLKLQQKDYSMIDASDLYFRKPISFEHVCRCIQVGKKISSKIHVRPEFLLNAFRYFDNKEYLISHVLLWSYLESVVNFIWVDYTSKLNLTKSKQFINNKMLSSSTKIEFLRLNGIFSEDIYEKIDNSRKKRNNTMHYMQNISKSDCKECIVAIRDVLCSFFNEYKKEIFNAFDIYVKKNKYQPKDTQQGIWLKLTPMPGSQFFAGTIPTCRALELQFSVEEKK